MNNTNKIPEFLYNMLLGQYGNDILNKIIDGYASKRNVTLRVNTLKTSVEKVKEVLDSNNIKYDEVSWYKEALIIHDVDENVIRSLSIYENGEVYLQSLSSMFPVVALEPKEDENILDMAAAPGGKTTQIVAMSNGNSLVTACEKNKIRCDRLRYNIEKQGATGVNILMQDSRNLDNYFSFDKILLDAPCSGSGTLDLADVNLEKRISKELVNRSVKTQFELLKKAITVLKSGHEMIYSTCSILKEENEENINKILKNKNIEIVPIDEELYKDIPQLPTSIKGTLCIMPSELYEGFYVAKLRKR